MSQVYGTTDTAASATTRSRFGPFPYGVQAGEYPQELVQLQLWQHEQEQCETSGSATK